MLHVVGRCCMLTHLSSYAGLRGAHMRQHVDAKRSQCPAKLPANLPAELPAKLPVPGNTNSANLAGNSTGNSTGNLALSAKDTGDRPRIGVKCITAVNRVCIY